MKKELLDALSKLFSENPILASDSVPSQEIDSLEAAVGFALPEDYKEFVAKYGGGIVGSFCIYGLRASHAMAQNDASAMEVTRRFRKFGWEGVSNWLVFSMDLGGSPIGFDSDGKVWISDHESREIRNIAQSFEDFLLKCFRNDL